MRFVLRVSAVMCGVALSCSAAFGQASPPSSSENALPDIVVTTAGRTPQKLSEVGSAISVVSREDIASRNPSSLVDVLRTVPGVDVSEAGGPGATTSVRLRGGNDNQTLVLIDGIRVNDPAQASGVFDFVTLPPAAIERIEVLRGPQSALYGSDAIGGVVNIITRTGKGPPRVDIHAEGGGPYGSAGGSAVISGSQDQWSYAFSGSGQKSDGFSRFGFRIPALERRYGPLESDGFRRFGGTGRVGYDNGNGVRLDAGAFVAYTRSDYDGATTSGITLPDTPSMAERTLYNGWSKGSFDSFGDLLTQSILFYANRSDRQLNSVSYRGNMLPQNTTSTFTDTLGDRKGAEYQANLRLPHLGSLIVGGKFERENIDTYLTNVLPLPGARLIQDYGQQDSQAAFALWQLPVGERLNFSFGGRFDEYIGDVRFKTYRSSVSYAITETGTKLRASAGSGGKAPTLYQRLDPTNGNRNLQSEESFGWDAGFDQTLFDGRGTFSVSYFENQFKNLIDFNLVTQRYFNTTRAVAQGVEVAGDIKLVPEYLALRGAYTNLTAYDELTGFTLQRRPRHAGTIALQATPVTGFLIEPRVYMVSERFSGTGNTLALAPFARFDLYSDYRIDKNWKVFARFENILDTHYQEIATYGTTGRAYYGGLDFTW